MKTIAEFVDSGIHTPEDLRAAMQTAIELEFSTIPPYLSAEWSIKSGDDPSAVRGTVRTIVLQEMLHFALTCNLLTAIGGTPEIAHAAFVPVYPTDGLPGDVHEGLHVDLLPLNDESLGMFMQIEYPEHGPIAKLAKGPATIGEFYDTIWEAIPVVNPSFVPNAIQVTGELPGLTAIRSAADAQAAISLIKEQGEGATGSPDQPSSAKLAHYYLFAEIFKRHKLINENGQWTFSGTPIQLPGVTAFVDHGPTAEFNTTFSDLLRMLDACWRSGADIGAAEDQMNLLMQQGVALIQAGVRPNFVWTDATKVSRATGLESVEGVHTQVGFAVSILPLFRQHDLGCMSKQGVPLNDYQYMSSAAGDATFPDHANARHVFARLSGAEAPQMPPDAAGRWSAQNLQLFAKWMDSGFAP